VNDKVFAQDFCSNKVKWMPGDAVEVTGPSSHHVRVSSGVIRQHFDALSQRFCKDTLAEALDEAMDPLN